MESYFAIVTGVLHGGWYWRLMMQSNRLRLLAIGMATGILSAAWAAVDPAVQLGFPPNVAAAMQGIDPERIRAHVRFLADDLLEGRGFAASGLKLEDMIAIAGTRSFTASWLAGDEFEARRLQSAKGP